MGHARSSPTDVTKRGCERLREVVVRAAGLRRPREEVQTKTFEEVPTEVVRGGSQKVVKGDPREVGKGDVAK